MSFATIDPQITAWGNRHGLTLFREAEVRFCYTSSDRGECFQIVIREPHQGDVMIEAFTIESTNDEEFRQRWDVHIADVEQGLEDALVMVENWKRGINRPPATDSSTRSA